MKYLMILMLSNLHYNEYCNVFNYGDYNSKTCYWDSTKKHIKTIEIQVGDYNILHSYYKNGVIELTRTLYKSNIVGKYYEWYEQGILRVEGNYGIIEESDLPVQMKAEPMDIHGFINFTSFLVASIPCYTYYIPKQGDWIYYYPNGMKKQICQYAFYEDTKSNKEIKIGTWLAWDENGKLILEQKFSNDSLISYSWKY